MGVTGIYACEAIPIYIKVTKALTQSDAEKNVRDIRRVTQVDLTTNQIRIGV